MPAATPPSTFAAPQRGGRGRARGVRHALTPSQWRRACGLAAAVLALHVVGIALLVIAVAPQDVVIGNGAVFGVGLGITAYTLGLRHAFDADHIGAIDNVTRKLMSDGQRPLSVGFWFSLGHSTVVFGLAALLALGVRGLSGAVGSDSSTLASVTGLIGPSVSGLFLIAIGVLNLVVLIGIVKVFVRMRRGAFDERQLEAQLASRGALNRVLGRATRAVTRPWHMYPLGVLFGLGFDTATEIALLATAGSAATAAGIPLVAILCLPILFAAGMSLLDTIDGAFMSFAYDWAFSRPVRKVYYNIAITGLSVVVALLIGTIELMSVLAERLSLTDGLFGAVAAIDLNHVGYVVVALFVLTWILAVAIWRLWHVEERWAVPQAAGEGAA